MRPTFDLEVRSFDSKEEMMAHVNSPEFNKPFDDYRKKVHEECTEGLSDENKKLYYAWHDGSYKPTTEEQLTTARENPQLYNAIMASISMGLG